MWLEVVALLEGGMIGGDEFMAGCHVRSFTPAYLATLLNGLRFSVSLYKNLYSTLMNKMVFAINFQRFQVFQFQSLLSLIHLLPTCTPCVGAFHNVSVALPCCTTLGLRPY